MKLHALLENLNTNLADTEVAGVTDDTRALKPGMVFVAIRGAKYDGHDAAAAMLEKGALLVITERPLGLGDREITVANTRLCI